eukprot:1392209-Amorphochlora_amoeboformis.AAC.1
MGSPWAATTIDRNTHEPIRAKGQICSLCSRSVTESKNAYLEPEVAWLDLGEYKVKSSLTRV